MLHVDVEKGSAGVRLRICRYGMCPCLVNALGYLEWFHINACVVPFSGRESLSAMKRSGLYCMLHAD